MKKLMLAGLFALTTVVTGCGVIDNAIDCNAICNRYKSCFDSNYDVGACENRCRTDANADTSYRTRADACNDCIGDKSCAASFNCAAPCSGIVP